MGVRISDMEHLSASLVDEDLFEICRYNEKKTYNVSAQQIAEYCKTLNNGGFKGTTKSAGINSLDDVDQTMAGVYYWNGDAPISGMPTSGMLEVFTYIKPKSSEREEVTVVERLTSANQVYTRSRTAQFGWSSWGVLTNVNGNKILSGRTSNGSVNFNAVLGRTALDGPFFDRTPVVTITPLNGSADMVHVANLITTDNTGFSVARFKSSMATVITNTTATKNTDGSGNTKEETTTKIERGAWELADFEYSWIATVDG